MMHLVELERQQAWAKLPREERMLQGRLWYASRNAQDLHNGTWMPVCTDPLWLRPWRARVRRSMAVLIALQLGEGQEAAEVSAELAAARREVTELRARIGSAVELALAQREVARLSAELLADERFATASTVELPIPSARAAS